MGSYILAIDQSTQGTKGLLFDELGGLVARTDRAHRQIVNEKGWVEHDPLEIIQNTLTVSREVAEKAGINKNDIKAIGISNQRETTLMWDAESGTPIYHAVVWQCSRATEACERPEIAEQADTVKEKTGINLSPFFPAAKLTWLMENAREAKQLAMNGNLRCGTMDTWLIYCLTEGKSFKTDYSNASRTQLFNIMDLQWDTSLCELFGIPMGALPEVCMSDSNFGETTLGGWLEKPVPIHGVLGDSHGALFGQNCRQPGQIKATYGTGSSVMMNIGLQPKFSQNGLVTSLAWGINGQVSYVFEGNLNYTGAVMTWLEKDVKLIENVSAATELAYAANPDDRTYFVPAFTGLGAPYWDSHATGLLTGITRTTGRNEIVKACLDCIAYQITDLTNLMGMESGMEISELRVDGGPTASSYLMQFQSSIANLSVKIPSLQELSGMGAAYAAGIAVKLYDGGAIYNHIQYREYKPIVSDDDRTRMYQRWKQAVARALYEGA